MDDRAVRTVTWRQLVISEKAQAARRQIFYLHAEHAIDSTGIIRGRLELTARGSLSGIRSLSTYYPVGTFRRGGKPAEIETRVSVEFELSLAGLSYQDIHILPGTDQEADQDRSGTPEFPGVIPDHETLIALTGTLSKESFYVKRVVEMVCPRFGGVVLLDFMPRVDACSNSTGVNIRGGSTSHWLRSWPQAAKTWPTMSARTGRSRSPTSPARPAPV